MLGKRLINSNDAAAGGTCTTNTNDYPTTNVAYYKMSSAADEKDTYNGTATDVNFNVAGKFGNAGEFNGSSSQITLPNTNSLSKSNNFSWSFWIYSDSFGSDNTILRLTSNYYTSVTVQSNKLMFYSDPTQHITPVNSVSTGVWQHFVITKSSTTGVVIYKMGALYILMQELQMQTQRHQLIK